jgi:hypothetical protein
MLSIAGLDPVQLEEAIPQFVFFGLLFVIFALVRPETIRDFDNRRLPNNPGARFTIVLVYLLVYAIVTAVFALFVGSLHQVVPTSLTSIAEKLNLKDLHLQAPFYATAALGGLWSIPFFKEIERHFVLRVHDTGHLQGDVELLSHHLQRCQFAPSVAERNRNLNDLKKFGVFVRDDGTEIVDMRNVNNWRKVSTLLRLLREWNRDPLPVLSAEEVKALQEIETAHDRKTHLAMTIIKVIKMMQEASQGQGASELLSDLMRKLSTSQPLGRGDLAEVEAQAKSMVGADTQSGTQAIKLSPAEFRAYLSEIEKYFEIEYDLLLQETAVLAAKATVLARAAGPQRLAQLKEVGFTGLGHIERINLDLVLWFFLVTTIGGFIVMSFGFRPNATPAGRAMAEDLARFSATMGMAGLIGTFVGSRRRYARAIYPPWSIYLIWGVISAALFVGAAVLHEVIRTATGYVPPPDQPAFSLLRQIPYGLLPFMVTVSICYLARVRRWQARRPGVMGQLIERAVDGICVSAAVFACSYVAIELYRLLNGDLPYLVRQMSESWHALPSVITMVLPYPIYWPLQVLTFLIGFIVVRDVRRVAHSTIVDDTQPPAAAPDVGALAKRSPAPA